MTKGLPSKKPPVLVRHLSGNPGGLNRSTQHSTRTHLALKTKAKIACQVRSAGTRPWLGFDQAQPNRSVPQGSIVGSTD